MSLHKQPGKPNWYCAFTMWDPETGTSKRGRVREHHFPRLRSVYAYSLRHSAVTLLKAAGVSDFIAREIIGHESAAVSRQYSHLSTGDLRNAMQRVPDVTR